MGFIIFIVIIFGIVIFVICPAVGRATGKVIDWWERETNDDKDNDKRGGKH